MKEIKENKGEVICIIGMHRSGTSMVSHLLNLCGLALGPSEQFLPPNEFNPRGYFENKRFVDINDALLAYFGGSWDNPPLFKKGWEREHSLGLIVNEAKLVLETFSETSRWGWKDPRTTILLPFWKSLIPGLRFVICVRSPLEVATSLAKRDEMPIQKGVYLWNQYMQAAIRDTEGYPRIFTFYEDFLKDAFGEIKRIVEFCRLQMPDDLSGLYNVISHDLKHHTSETAELLSDEKVITEYKLFYIGLRALSVDGFMQLPPDSAREAVISENIGKFFKLLERFHDEHELARLQSDLAEKGQQITNLYATVNRQHATISQQHATISQQQHTLSQKGEQIAKLITHQETLTQELKGVQTTLNEREEQIAQLQTTTQAQQQELDIIHASAGWKLLNRFWQLENKILAPGTRGRELYDSILRRIGVRAYLKARRIALQNSQDHLPKATFIPNRSTKSTTSTPKLSVCIPTYNGAKYLSEAIISVLDQTYWDFELILVDDCSTDNTEAVIKSFSDSRIKYFKNPVRLGLAGNWNKCVELSSGDYICIFHQDDVMLPENLEEKVKVMEESPNVGMVHSNVFQIGPAGELIREYWPHKPYPTQNGVHNGPEYFKTLLLGPNIVCCPSAVVRRECYEKLGGFDSRLPFTTDWEMWMRIALFYDIAYLIKPLIKYRRHDGMETFNFLDLKGFEQYYRAKMLILEKHPERISDASFLRLQVAQDFEKQALEKAAKYYREHQFRKAKEYLSFAVEVHANTVKQTSDGEHVDWFISAIDQMLREEPLPYPDSGTRRKKIRKKIKKKIRKINKKIAKIINYLPMLLAPKNPAVNLEAPENRVISNEEEVVISNEDVTISVVIPTKNAGEDFGYLLGMLSNQKGFKNLEIITVDSGSTDMTLEIAAKFGAKIIGILPEEFSHSYARNVGAEHASGDYLLFTVQDALPPSDSWLWELFRVIKGSDVVAVSCAEYPRDDADLFYRAISWYHYNFLEVSKEDRILCKPINENYLTLRKNGQLSNVACLISKDIIMKYKFRGDYAEDLELGLRLIRDGHKLALLSSTRIIHSHNRPAYYYLKRGYVDNLFLLRFFPDHPALDGEVAAERVFYDIAFTYEVINSIVQKELPGVSLPCSVKELSTIVTERLRGAVKDRYPTFMKTVSNGFVDSKFAFFLQDLSDRYYLNGNINSRYNGVLVEAVLNAMKEILKYMGDTYELIDEHIIEDFKSCFYKAFAFKCGVYLANCFFHDSESTREKLKKINSELTKEV